MAKKHNNWLHFREYNDRPDPYAHLRKSRVRGKKPKKQPTPGVRRITREVFIERIEAKHKNDGIPLTIIGPDGIIEHRTIRKSDEIEHD